MISLYSTAFNLNQIDVNFDEVFSNWLYYVDEIVIATFRREHEEVRDKVVQSKFYDSKKIGVVSRHLDPETDCYWDGKLKAAALKNCRKDVALQCDLDERISGDLSVFKNLEKEILKHDFACSIMLPSIDLYGDLDHMVNIGYKWYLHTRKETTRGAVLWAKREDGSFDPEKSDTCELIDERGQLIPCIGKVSPTENDPKIIHLGYLDLEARKKLNKDFWDKVWNKRYNRKTSPDCGKEKLNGGDPRKKPHNLSHPLWPTL
mgnify:CR=1 FL=1|tara:strand:- start:805 stop:1587 length:783 start_codon:yes stop_codon:yes gene_type:complete